MAHCVSARLYYTLWKLNFPKCLGYNLRKITREWAILLQKLTSFCSPTSMQLHKERWWARLIPVLFLTGTHLIAVTTKEIQLQIPMNLTSSLSARTACSSYLIAVTNDFFPPVLRLQGWVARTYDWSRGVTVADVSSAFDPSINIVLSAMIFFSGLSPTEIIQLLQCWTQFLLSVKLELILICLWALTFICQHQMSMSCHTLLGSSKSLKACNVKLYKSWLL